MAFPQKNWFGFRKGWSDMGEKCHAGMFTDQFGNINTTYTVCILCRSKVHVGKDEGGTFIFCPRCLTELG